MHKTILKKRRERRNLLRKIIIGMYVILMCFCMLWLKATVEAAPNYQKIPPVVVEPLPTTTTVGENHNEVVASEERIIRVEILEKDADYVIDLASGERELFEKVVYAEAGNQSEDGMFAVAETIVNRVLSNAENYGDTLTQVVNNGFSSVRKGIVYIGKTPVAYDQVPEEVKEAVEKALKGEKITEKLLLERAEELGLGEEYGSGGALYFYNPDACPKSALEERKYIKVDIQIGDHIFYKVWDTK